MNNKTLIIGAAAIGVGYFLYKKFVLDKATTVDDIEIEPDPSGGKGTKPNTKPTTKPNKYSPFDGKPFVLYGGSKAKILTNADLARFMDYFYQGKKESKGADYTQQKIDLTKAPSYEPERPYDSSLAIRALGLLSTQSQFAYIAWKFADKYKVTLKSYLTDKLGSLTIQPFIASLMSKPQYTV
jgi:hypothetical protein